MNCFTLWKKDRNPARVRQMVHIREHFYLLFCVRRGLYMLNNKGWVEFQFCWSGLVYELKPVWFCAHWQNSNLSLQTLSTAFQCNSNITPSKTNAMLITSLCVSVMANDLQSVTQQNFKVLFCHCEDARMHQRDDSRELDEWLLGMLYIILDLKRQRWCLILIDIFFLIDIPMYWLHDLHLYKQKGVL